MAESGNTKSGNTESGNTESGNTESGNGPPEGGSDFSDDLARWLAAEGALSLGDLADEFGERSFAVLALLLMFLPSLPIPTGGLTHIMEIVTMVVAVEMLIGLRTIWLPGWARRRAIPDALRTKGLPFVVRRIRWFERFTKPRMTFVFRRRVFQPVLGLLILVMTIGAFVAPPFSFLDTLPSLGVVIIALAIILEDAVVALVGAVVGLVGIALIVTIGAAAAEFFRNLF